MTNRNQFNQNNNNLRAQGGINSWVAEINNEIYQNLDQIEAQLNSDRNQNQNQINNFEQRLQGSLNQINDHEGRLILNQNKVASIENELVKKQDQINQIVVNDLPSKQSAIDVINTRLIDYEKKMQDYDARIVNFNEIALNRLAEAYTNMADGEKDQIQSGIRKNGLKQDRNRWLIFIYVIFPLIITIDVLILLLNDFNFVDKTIYYLIAFDIPAFTFLYFSVAQYSYYKKLYMEYKNREVVAKSYLGILNNVENNEHERGIITQIVADTLFTRNVADQGSDLPVREALKIVEKTAGVASTIIKKGNE